MDQNAENTNRPLALILTFGTHAVLVLFFLYFYIITPNPPYPEGGGSGLGVNFGTSEDGSGEEQPEQMLPMNLEEPVHNEKTIHKTSAKEEDIETQNTEETANIKTSDKKNIKKEEIKKEEITENKETKVEKKKEVDKKTLFKGNKNNDSKNEGETHGNGDQGKKEGNPKSKLHWGSGNGEGNGDGKGDGKGNGDGDGEGDGKDKKKGDKNGKEKGVSFSLKGRNAKDLPKPDYNDDDEGKVVIDVIVDREGNVTKATEGKGTTTSSIVLKNAAKRAAMNAKFSKNPDAAEFQKGTITYIFKQQ